MHNVKIPPGHITQTETAKRLGVSKSTLSRWRKYFTLPVHPGLMIRTGMLLYREEDVQRLRDWMNAVE
jgi:DNA-binding transcriptional MerR regulator